MKGLFDDPTTPAEPVLAALAGLVDPRTGIIRLLAEERDYLPDEPAFLLWRSEVAATTSISDGGYARTTATGGRGIDATEARTGAVFEALERYCLSIYRRADLVESTHRALSARGEEALDPVALAGEPADPGLRDATLQWVTATSVCSGAEVRVPAQLVYLPYAFPDGEPELRDPLTTGAAAGLDVGFAVRNGLLEAIERDAVMLLHYRRPAVPALAPAMFAGTDVQWMLREIDRYGLRCSLFHVDTGLPVHVVVCRIDDPHGSAPAQNVASKASPSVVDAARGALLEAALLRRSLRVRADEVRRTAEHYLPDLSSIDCLTARSYVWAQPEMTRHLEYLRPSEVVDDVPGLWRGSQALVEEVADRTGDVLMVDVTTPDVRDLGVTVVKVVAPGLQPMHLGEQWTAWMPRLLSFGGRVEPADLNPIPHPFL